MIWKNGLVACLAGFALCAIAEEWVYPLREADEITSLDGEWDFTLVRNDDEKPDAVTRESGKIRVPGNWETQGYKHPQYGNQMQNGGTIFYISYYDLIGRYATDPESAFDRFSVIMEEFHKDSLRRNSRTYFGEYVEGILGEFPESGLVPYTFVSGLCGITTTVDGLKIDAALPSEMDYAGITCYKYGNRTYSIRVDRTISQPVVEKYSDGTYYVQIPADQVYYITADNRLRKG